MKTAQTVGRVGQWHSPFVWMRSLLMGRGWDSHVRKMTAAAD